MKLVRIEKLPTNGDGPRYRMTFDNDGKQYVKIKPFGFHGWRDRKQLIHSLLRACKEAERDVAYDMFGDDWQKHVGPFWTTEPSPFMRGCLEKISKALDE